MKRGVNVNWNPVRMQLAWCLLTLGVLNACSASTYFGTERAVRIKSGHLVLPKGPYQVSIGPTELLIAAEFPIGNNGTLKYWREGVPEQSRVIPFVKHWDGIDVARIVDLEIGSRYRFQIVVGEFSTRVHSFRAGPGDGESFKFLVIGDTKEGTPEIHADLVRLMEQRDAAFYVHLGDFVRHGDIVDDWNTFFEMHRALMSEMPILPVVGNHDISDVGLFSGLFLKTARKPVGNRYYETKFGKTLVIVLDSSGPIVKGDRQYDFLEASLKKSKTVGIEHIFVALHKPFYSSGSHGNTKTIDRRILSLLEQYKVDAVLAGHDHQYERSRPINGIVHFVSGGGGADLTPVDQQACCNVAINAFHFLEFTVRDSEIEMKAINSHGTVIDEVKLK